MNEKMPEEELGLRCSNCGTVYLIQSVEEKVDKKCVYCDNDLFESVGIVVSECRKSI